MRAYIDLHHVKFMHLMKHLALVLYKKHSLNIIMLSNNYRKNIVHISFDCFIRVFDSSISVYQSICNSSAKYIPTFIAPPLIRSEARPSHPCSDITQSDA